MPLFYKFIIRQDTVGAIVVVREETGEVFYTARNRSKYEAIQECIIYMSTFPNTQVSLEPKLNEFYKKLM